MNAPTTARPGYLPGTWTISPVNSDVSFTVRHLGVTTVHGRFNEVTGTIRGVRRPVSLAVELGGFGDDPAGGGPVLGLSAAVTLHRADFGFSPDIPALIIGEDISVRLDVHAVRQA